MSAYELLIKSIARRSQTADEYTKKANTFFVLNQLSEDEYTDVIQRISLMQ